MITMLLAAATIFVSPAGPQGDYGIWGTPPITRSDTAQLKDRDSFIIAAGNATVGLGPELQRLKNEGKVLDLSKSTMPVAVPIADEINYLNDQLRQKVNGDRMNAVNKSLTYLLLNSDQPSFTGIQNPFVKHTKAPAHPLEGTDLTISRELALAIKVSQSKGDLLPADIMRMSLEACRGDLQSALLTSHNFLKELGYAARPGAAGPAMFCQIPGKATTKDEAKAEGARIAAQIGNGFRAFAVKQDNGKYVFDIVATDGDPLIGKLRSLRPTNDTIVDKMGPWYHSFVGLVIGSVSTGGEITAGTWAKLEALMRSLSIFGLFSSPPDYFKELITERMAAESGTLMEIMGTTLKLVPARTEIDLGATASFTADAQRPSTRSEVWFKWSFGRGAPVWSRNTSASHTYPDSGEFAVTVEMYDNLKVLCLAKAKSTVKVRDTKVVKGSWNLVSATVISEVGFKDQNNTSTGGNNAWSGDPMGGRIYRSWGWGYEGDPWVSPLKFEAMHVWELPKSLKPGSKIKCRVSIVDVKYTKVNPAPSARGYTMSTLLSIAAGFDPNNLSRFVEVRKGVYDGSKDMNAPEPVEQEVEFVVPAVDKRDLVFRVYVGGTAPAVVFELRYRLN